MRPGKDLVCGDYVRLLTLLDIVKKFDLPKLIMVLEAVHNAQIEVRKVRAGQQEELSTKWLQQIADEGGAFCRHVGFNRAAEHAAYLVGRIRLRGNDFDASHAEAEIDALARMLERDVYDFRFIQVDIEHADYLDNAAVFGSAVMGMFPSAAPDMEGAANCIAMELWTASVFHLMRVAEQGLRALARDRRIVVPRGTLELANWEEIIRELEKAEDKIKDLPKTLARESQFEFYHSAMMDMRAIKNRYRNPVMHSRSWFNRHEALGARDRVFSLMQKLATRIGENKRTPLIWRRP